MYLRHMMPNLMVTIRKGPTCSSGHEAMYSTPNVEITRTKIVPNHQVHRMSRPKLPVLCHLLGATTYSGPGTLCLLPRAHPGTAEGWVWLCISTLHYQCLGSILRLGDASVYLFIGKLEGRGINFLHCTKQAVQEMMACLSCRKNSTLGTGELAQALNTGCPQRGITSQTRVQLDSAGQNRLRLPQRKGSPRQKKKSI